MTPALVNLIETQDVLQISRVSMLRAVDLIQEPLTFLSKDKE